MNATCDNQEMLLRQLSLQGDPTAFFSLCKGYFGERYLRERKSGVSHDDAQDRIVTEATTLFEELQQVKAAQFDTWFEEHCTLLPASSSDADFEKENTSFSFDIERCFTSCSRALLRSGSDVAKKKNRRNSGFFRRVFNYTLTKVIVTAVAFAGLFFLGTFLLRKFDTTIGISVMTSSDTLKLQYPSVLKPEKDSVFFLPAITKDTVDTIAADTGNTNEELKPLPVQKKKVFTPKSRPVQPKTPPVVRKPKPVKTYSNESRDIAPPATVIPPVQTAPAVAAPPPPPSPAPQPQPKVEPVRNEEPSTVTPEEPPVESPAEPVSPEPAAPASDIPDLM